MTRVLDVKGLTGGYGSVQILYGIDMHIDEGEFVTIIGPMDVGSPRSSKPYSVSLITTRDR